MPLHMHMKVCVYHKRLYPSKPVQNQYMHAVLASFYRGETVMAISALVVLKAYLMPLTLVLRLIDRQTVLIV